MKVISAEAKRDSGLGPFPAGAGRLFDSTRLESDASSYIRARIYGNEVDSARQPIIISRGLNVLHSNLNHLVHTVYGAAFLQSHIYDKIDRNDAASPTSKEAGLGFAPAP